MSSPAATLPRTEQAPPEPEARCPLCGGRHAAAAVHRPRRPM
ncbi:hypothetical protein ACI8AF_01215 [Blastococcus sp. SYSU D00669]